MHIDIDGFVSDTDGESSTSDMGAKYGTSDTHGRSEDFMTYNEELPIKAEPIPVEIKTEEEQIMIKGKPIPVNMMTEDKQFTFKEEPIPINIKAEEEQITIKEEPIDLPGWI